MNSASLDEQTQRLFKAAAGLNREAVVEAIQAGAIASAINEAGHSALDIWAQGNGQGFIINALLQAGAHFTSPMAKHGRAQMTGLHWAARFGDVTEARRLLSLGADPNAREVDGWTPLALCAFKAPQELFELLRSAGADITVNINEGSSLFLVSVGHSNPVFTDWCLKNKAMSKPPEEEVEQAIKRLEDLSDAQLWEDERSLLEKLRALRESQAIERETSPSNMKIKRAML